MTENTEPEPDEGSREDLGEPTEDSEVGEDAATP